MSDIKVTKVSVRNSSLLYLNSSWSYLKEWSVRATSWSCCFMWLLFILALTHASAMCCMWSQLFKNDLVSKNKRTLTFCTFGVRFCAVRIICWIYRMVVLPFTVIKTLIYFTDKALELFQVGQVHSRRILVESKRGQSQFWKVQAYCSSSTLIICARGASGF